MHQQNLSTHDYRYSRPPDIPPPQPPSSSVRRSTSNLTLVDLQTILLQNPTLLHRLEQDYVGNLLYDLVFEVAIDVMWSIKSGSTTIEELYGVKPFTEYYSVPIKAEEKKVRYNIARPPLPPIPTSTLPNYPSSSSSTLNHQPHTSSSSSSNHNSKNVHCPVCNELVAAVRFAYHLEKCINGGKRGSRKHYDYLRDETYERPRPKKEHVDPFPNSMIVKIKLKNGVPVATGKRVGATLEEFLAAKESNQNGTTYDQDNDDDAYTYTNNDSEAERISNG